MKNLLLIVVLAAVLLAAGCTGGNQNPAAPSAPPVTVTATPSPPAAAVTGTVPPAAAGTATPAARVTTTAAVTAAETGIPDQDSVTYTNKEFRFAIQIPRCWTASGDYVTTPGGGKKYKVVFDDPTLTSLQYVTITPGSQGLSLDDWDKIFTGQLKTDPSVTIVGEFPAQLDGVTAKKLDVITRLGNTDFESTIMMAVNGDNAYFLEFESRKDDYLRYSKDADRMIQTFRFT
jgi:hypothetical protein